MHETHCSLVRRGTESGGLFRLCGSELGHRRLRTYKSVEDLFSIVTSFLGSLRKGFRLFRGRCQMTVLLLDPTLD